jgi:SHAQKYF class myb-like DNA-binding protein
MTISKRVQKQFFAAGSTEINQLELIRLPPTVVVQYNARDANPSACTHNIYRRGSTRGAGRRTNLWSVEEHERFLEGLHRFPRGPWKQVAAVVRTKTVRQTMTHAQKYRQKIERMARRDSQDADGNQSEDIRTEPPEEEMKIDLARFINDLEMHQTDLQTDMDALGLDPVPSEPMFLWADLLESVRFDPLLDSKTEVDAREHLGEGQVITL